MPCALPTISTTSSSFSGDGDFRSLVAALQQKGKRVSVVSTLQTQPPMVADELRRQADQFVDLADLEDQVGRARTAGASRAKARAAIRVADRLNRRATDLSRRRRPRRRRGLIDLLRRGSADMAGTPAAGARRPEAPKMPRCARASSLTAKKTKPRNRAWFNGAVPSFGDSDARLLIVGLAPGLNGANRTGRPFTGDFAGDSLRDTSGVRLCAR